MSGAVGAGALSTAGGTGPLAAALTGGPGAILGILVSSPAGLAALAAVPLIVILHALSRRWARREVSSLLFWEAAAREAGAARLLHSLVRSLPLLLQVLAAALLAFSLSQPLLVRPGFGGRGWMVLVLDETASMGALEGQRPRFEEARARALQAVSALPRGASMCVVAAARGPRLVVPFTDDRSLLARRLRAEQVTDEPGDLRDSLPFALSLRDPRRGDSVVLITDGAFDTLGALDDPPSWLHVVALGGPARNAAVTALSLRRAVSGSTGYELFVEVRSFWRQQMSFPLTVRADGEAILTESLTMGPGEVRRVTAAWDGPRAGSVGARVEAEIEAGDDLPTDDRAYAVVSPAAPVSVSVEGPPDFFLLRALSALPGVTVRGAGAGAAAGTPRSPGNRQEVTVYNQASPPPLGRGNFILISALPPDSGLRAAGSLASPAVTGWDRLNPLMAAVPAGSLVIRGALRLEGRGFTPLAWSRDAPLILSWQKEDQRVLLLAFSLEESDLALRPAFPLLLANALTWFFPRWLSAEADQTRAGEPREIPVPAGPGLAGTAEVRSPGGARTSLSVDGQSVRFTRTEKAGFYEVTAAGRSSTFAVSTTSPEESDISPRYAPARAAAGTSDGVSSSIPAPGTSLSPLWGILSAAAMALLLAEWLAAARSRA
jgi:hypothetical protein